MARALVVGSPQIEVEGDNLVLTWMVMFYGNDVNPPDFTNCRIVGPDTATVSQTRTAIRNQIQAKATAAGINWNGTLRTVFDLFSGISS